MKQKIVVGTTNNSIFNVKQGKECVYLRCTYYNGEVWYLLQDLKTNERFESPAMFWESKTTKGV